MAMAIATPLPSSQRTRGMRICCFQEGSTSRRTALIASIAGTAFLKIKPGLALQTEGVKEGQLREVLHEVVNKSRAPGLLRLAFHDAGTYNMSQQTGGMNGSIIYELERPENGGLERSIKVLRKVRERLEPSLQVSWADLIAVAGSEAIKACGGPHISIRLGRLDTSVPDPEGELPSEDLDATALKQSFNKKGFSTQEMVALAGAHTLGSKGFGNPTVFDNSYYEVLLRKPWTDPGSKMASMIGLPSDRALIDDKECFRWLEIYKQDQTRFYDDFSAAYSKLVNLGASWAG